LERQRQYRLENGDRLRERYAEKVKAANAAYRATNKDKITAYQAQYCEAHREEARQRSMAYLNANRDAIYAKARAEYDPATSWEKLNPEKAKAYRKAYVASVRHKRAAYEQNRRAKKAAGGELPVDIVQRLLELQKGKCACCTKPLKGLYHLDHIMPISRGGENTERNVQLLLPQCNLQKNAKDPIDFMQSRGFLL
jgi:5-methylcytosine-specific restriction endonuclease McrA